MPRDAVRVHAAVYLLFHAATVPLSLGGPLPPLLYESAALHTAFLVVLVAAAVRQGAMYYRHAWGEKLARSVAKALTKTE